MASEEKESSVLFTLKELKDIAATPTAEPEQVAKPKARQSKGGAYSFIDDADSLLADIRDSVDDDASAEATRIEGERKAAAAAEEQNRRSDEAKRQADIEAKLQAEQARRRAAADEREARAHALDIAERRARGEIIEEPEPQAAPQPAQVAPTAPAAPPKKSFAFYLMVIALPLIALGGIGAMVLMDDSRQFTNVRGTGKDVVRNSAARAAAELEPDAAVDASYVDAAPKLDAAPKKKRKARKRRTGRKPTAGKSPGKKKGIGFKFGSSDKGDGLDL
jgi:hypothetical protein